MKNTEHNGKPEDTIWSEYTFVPYKNNEISLVNAVPVFCLHSAISLPSKHNYPWQINGMESSNEKSG